MNHFNLVSRRMNLLPKDTQEIDISFKVRPFLLCKLVVSCDGFGTVGKRNTLKSRRIDNLDWVLSLCRKRL